MSILRGASGAAAEVWFHLADATDPLTPVTGHSFSTGEVLVWLPSTGSFGNANVSNIVEKGFGDYALQLTALESASAGTTYLLSAVSSTQPFRSFDFITDPLDPPIHELPFALIPASDPVLGDGSGHSFTLGEVQFRFSGAAYVNTPLVQIVERGHSCYGVVLTSGQRDDINDVYLSAQVSGMVPFSAQYDLLGNPSVIFLQTSGLAAEIAFHLTSSTDGVTPVTGHTFAPGEVMVRWPTSPVFVAASPSDIVEKGFGDYALQGSALDTADPGTAYLYVSAGGALNTRSVAFVTDPQDPAPHELPFTLLPVTDPVNGSDTGQAFTLGQVQLLLSGLSYTSVPLTRIIERGFSMYAVVLTAPQRAFVNTSSVYASVPGIVPFSADWEMLNTLSLPSTLPIAVSIVGAELPAGPYVNRDVRHTGDVQVIAPTGHDLVAVVAANLSANLRAQQLSDLTLPSIYKRAFLIAHATDEIAITKI